MIIELQSRKNPNKFHYPTQEEWENMKLKGLDYNWKMKIISDIPEPRIQSMPHIEIIEYQKTRYEKMKKADLMAELKQRGIEYKASETKEELLNKL